MTESEPWDVKYIMASERIKARILAAFGMPREVI